MTTLEGSDAARIVHTPRNANTSNPDNFNPGKRPA
jgi:hypothetical protein